MNSTDPRKSLAKNGVFKFVFFSYCIILVLLGLFFAFIYEDQEWVPYLGNQFEFLGGLICGILLWIGVVFFSILGGYKFLRTFILGTIFCLLAFVGLFRFTEMDGDMIPKFSPRWVDSTQTTRETKPEENTSVLTSNWIFPQFQGPNRNCILTNIPPISTSWVAKAPEVIWIKPVGESFSGFVIQDEKAFSIAQDTENPENESVFCINFYTGEILWSHSYQSRLDAGLGGIGSRATPLIYDQKVYFLGGTGIFTCVDLTTEKIIFQFDSKEKFGAKIPEWGFAGSPMVYKDRIIIAPGGGQASATLVALNPASGDVIWQVGNKNVSWSSPAIKQINGKDYLIHLDAESVEIRDPLSGKLILDIPWGLGFPQVSIPILSKDDHLIVSSGYSVGASSYSIFADESNGGSDYKIKRIWKTKRLRSKFAPLLIPPSNPDLVLALNDGVFAGFEASSGKRLFQGERYGHGQFLLISKKDLLIQTEKGALVLLDISGKEPVEKAKFEVFKSKTWNPPAVVGNYVLMRNHRNMALVRLPVPDNSSSNKSEKL